MRLKTLCAAFLIGFVAVACAEAENAAENAAEEVREGAEEVVDEAKEAGDRAEDFIDDESVDIDDFSFEPASVEIEVGTEVTWTNRDSVEHTIVADDDLFSSEELSEGDEFSNRFTDKGSFSYHCSIHGADRMSGTVVVS